MPRDKVKTNRRADPRDARRRREATCEIAGLSQTCNDDVGAMLAKDAARFGPQRIGGNRSIQHSGPERRIQRHNGQQVRPQSEKEAAADLRSSADLNLSGKIGALAA